MKRARSILPLVAMLAAGAHELVAQPPEAGNNPFARSAPSPEGGRTESSGLATPTFTLRATLTAGADSLVNVDGRILELGEEFAGYRLLEVGEGTAVFGRNGRRFEVAISSSVR